MSIRLTSLDDAAWTSPWRHRAVRDKALLSAGLIGTALFAPVLPGGVLAALASTAVLVGPARVPGRLFVEAMVVPVLFTVLGAVPVAVAVGPSTADAWWSWGALSVGPDGAARAVALVVHGVAGAAAVMVLATTTPVVDLVTASRRLRVPEACLDVAALIYRWCFVLLDTVVTVREAQAGRLGTAPVGRPGRSVWQGRMETTGALVGVVLVRSWARAARLSDGLAGRGYDGDLITLPRQRESSPFFLAATVAGLLMIWAVTALWTWYGLGEHAWWAGVSR
ncbi:cobalt ECF transporter T component CbiQ [Austwickia chelonae]|uniref:cobalt ECF transporter T component CbiQ n=1 Tax=Austwickia chelonae TaxID=100225 RepID=UPI001966D38D|nr:cobalt ECF transporter T component CbiQ [Austwickia chelonae]